MFRYIFWFLQVEQSQFFFNMKIARKIWILLETTVKPDITHIHQLKYFLQNNN